MLRNFNNAELLRVGTISIIANDVLLKVSTLGLVNQVTTLPTPKSTVARSSLTQCAAVTRCLLVIKLAPQR